MADLDLARIKRNVTRMAAQNAPIEDIDGYIASEGTTVDAVRAFRPASAAPASGTAPAASPVVGTTPPRPHDFGALAASVNAGGHALGFGFGDEITAGMMTPIELGIQAYEGKPISVSDAYNSVRERQHAQLTADRENHPVAATVGEIGGAVATPGGSAKTLRGAVAQGAAGGGVYAFGSGEGGVDERLAGVPGGIVAGIAGGAGSRLLGNVVTKAAARRSIPTTQELEAAGDALYNVADAANVVLKPQTVQRMVGNAKLAAGRLDTGARPFTASTIADFEAKLGQPMGLRELDDLRKVVGNNLASATAKEDRAQITIIKKQMDAMADGLKAGDLASGQLDGVAHLKEARRLWSMKSKAAEVEMIMRDAEIKTAGTGNFENRVRDQFKSIAVDEDRLAQFTPEEQDAILKVARGGPVVNTLRVLGKFAPDSPLLPLIGYSGAAATSGFVPALAVPAAGLAAKAGASAITRGNVRALDEIIRSGGQTVGDIVKQGRLGRGSGVAAVREGQRVANSLLGPLSVEAAQADAYRRR